MTDHPLLSVLLVDGDLDLLTEMSLAFDTGHFEVHLAADADEGLWLFEQVSPDLVVTDLALPSKGGMDLIAKIKHLRPATKVIAVSAGGRSAPRDELMVARYVGADETLTKPFAPDSLLALARRVLTAA